MLTACGTDDAPTVSQDPDREQQESYEQGPTQETGVVSLADAQKIALDAIGEGRVTWSGPEDDHGAAWEIEITRPDGREVDVLVAPDGTVIE